MLYTYIASPIIELISKFSKRKLENAKKDGILPPPSTDDAIAPISDDCRVSTAIISDVHVSEVAVGSMLYYRNVVTDLKNAKDKLDCLISLGDSTEDGMKKEWSEFYSELKRFDVAKDYAIATGNHDIRGRVQKEVLSFFTRGLNELTGRQIDKMYYSIDVGGYKFIVIGSEKESLEKAYISKTQLSFIDNELADGTRDGKPVFVLSHYLLKRTHGLPELWDAPIKSGDLGEQSDDVRDILLKYKNVFYLTGHMHTGFGKYTYEELGGVHLVNVPSTGDKENKAGENLERGTGMTMEIYDDRVVFRARNFATGKYIDGFERSYELI